MTAFVLLAAALTLAALRPISRELLVAGTAPRAWRTGAAVSLGVPLIAVMLYAHLGRPAALAPQSLAEGTAVDPVRQMVQRLADRLQRAPDDAEGWALLARAYEQLGRPEDALPAYVQLERLRPGDAQVLSQHAVTLAMVKGEGLTGEPEALLQRALAADPKHVPSLALAAAAAEERGDAVAARGLWGRVLAEVPTDSEVKRQALENLARLRGLASERR